MIMQELHKKPFNLICKPFACVNYKQCEIYSSIKRDSNIVQDREETINRDLSNLACHSFFVTLRKQPVVVCNIT